MELGLYIHYPYCLSKCPYCDFNSHVAKAIDVHDLTKAYINELAFYQNLIQKNFVIKTIFFGGGTPSLMDKKLLTNILEHIKNNYNLAEDIEITLEANPSTIENDKIKFFRDVGINRISLGVQSFDDDVLKFLGRKHDVKTAINALDNIQKYFSNFSLDLIYGIHNQDLNAWNDNLTTAFKFNSNHISLYQLTIEKGTEFYRRYNKDQLQLMNDDLQADLYDFTYEKAAKFGYNRYEISNFAKSGFESKHNLNYWRSGDYIGIGAGAHSRLNVKNQRYGFINYHKPEKWCQNAILGNAVQNKEIISQETEIEEYLMMGLRLKDGINLLDFKQKFQQDLLSFVNKEQLNKLINDNFLMLDNNRLVIEKSSFKLTNNILAKILT